MVIGGHTLLSREGLIIQLISDDGFEGFGEIAPLPGISQENIEDSLKQILFLKSKLTDKALTDTENPLNGHLDQWLGENNLNPSVRFGIEMAIINLVAESKDKSVNRLLTKTHHPFIRINGLLFGSKNTVINQAIDLVHAGFTSLKLKVGQSMKEDISKVQALQEVIGKQALLHLDANRAWNLNKAVHFGHEIGCDAIDYIEEPFPDVRQIPDFFMKTTIPVALDESLTQWDLDAIKSIVGVKYLVLKPTILGGLKKILDIMSQAKHWGLKTIISSSFESDIGLLTLANLASCNERDTPAGLDTLKWFNQNLLKEKLNIQNGKLEIPKQPLHSTDINFDCLKEIS